MTKLTWKQMEPIFDMAMETGKDSGAPETLPAHLAAERQLIEYGEAMQRNGFYMGFNAGIEFAEKTCDRQTLKNAPAKFGKAQSE